MRGRRLDLALVYAALFIATLVAIGPFLWMVSTALSTAAIPTGFLPDRITFQNFAEAWNTGNFPRLFANSLLVATTSAVLNVAFNSMAAFAFSRLEFPGRRILFGTILATMMLPTVVTVVPLFLIVRSLPGGSAGWVNTFPGIFMPGAASAFGIFLLRQYFSTLPRDLDEAARLDGCSPWRIYWEVVLPLSKPALLTVAIFSFVLAWNDFLWPLIVATDGSMYTVQVGLSYFSTEHSIRWPILMSAATLITLPVLAIYLVLQRFFLQGIATTGMRE